MFEFWKNEWKLFMDDLRALGGMFSKIFGSEEYLMLDSAEESNNMFAEDESYSFDSVDNNIENYFGETVDELRKNLSNDGTQPVSYTHLTLPTIRTRCRSRWSPYH